VRVRPVVNDAATVVGAVADSTRETLLLHSELDVDVYRLHRTESDPDLVARAFGPSVERAAVDAAAHVLQSLADTRFPAERCPTDTPVLALGSGRHVLVTEYVEPSPAPRPGFVLAWCAGLLGRLANRSGADLPSGGGWHRLGATPSHEIDEALRLGSQVGPSVAELVDALADADDGVGLPEALIHADLTPANAVPQGDQPPVVIDWIGVGRGPRIWPLAFLLFAAGPGGASRGLERYCRSISLSDEERARLPGVMTARPLTLDLWSVAHERMTAQQAVTRCRAHHARIEAVTRTLNDLGRV
jgi:Ser/Thr protein kinase RdoA (MazF antagonist)